jgi:hypothetical protein
MNEWAELSACVGEGIRRRLGCAWEGPCDRPAHWEQAIHGGWRYWCRAHGLLNRPHQPEQVLVLPSEGPALRPHTIPGWWQVWSGHICIALLTPEDVAPVAKAAAPVEADSKFVDRIEGDEDPLPLASGAHVHVCDGPHTGTDGRVTILDPIGMRALVDRGGGRRGGLIWVPIANLRKT